jgi:tRNA U34 5-methylaminomethyl-2-thiouridine-forming methyltransferase MnmC
LHTVFLQARNITCECNTLNIQAHWVIDDLIATLWDKAIPTVEPLDAIFHDAFSWRKVPHLWTTDVFRTYKTLLKQAGVLLTYSRASRVKEALRAAGYTLANTPGLGGKKGGLLAL